MFRKSSFPDHGLHFLLRLFQWGKDRPPTGQFEQYSPQTSLGSAMNSASTPGGYGTQPSPYFPQYGGPPGPMTPQGNFAVNSFPVTSIDLLAGPSPVGRPAWETAQQHTPYGGQAMPGQGMPGQGLPGQGMPGHGIPNQAYGQMPGSA